MDSLRGSFSDRGADDVPSSFYDLGEDEVINDPPPSPVGQDERRMQVRAYNPWASLPENPTFPSDRDLGPAALPDGVLVVHVAPSESSWQDGDREVECLFRFGRDTVTTLVKP